ncbi:hypothetical protein BX616_006234, partial [Lobosporangium transversale]
MSSNGNSFTSTHPNATITTASNSNSNSSSSSSGEQHQHHNHSLSVFTTLPSDSIKHALTPANINGNAEMDPPYVDVLIAGGLGGTLADFLLHSVDTVKTRLQGQPAVNPPKYHNMFHAYSTILREEGISRGLYSGVAPAMTGSQRFKVEAKKWEGRPDGQMSIPVEMACGAIAGGMAGFLTTPLDVMKTLLQTQVKKPSVLPGTTLYFGTYEYTKRTLTGAGCPDVIAHLAAGSLGDFIASFIYVPSEVLKTRMQLQGRYNNPSFISGYNYKNTWHALQMIIKYDG